MLEENAEIDRLRAQGTRDLYAICREFVDALNTRLAEPVILLDPSDPAAAIYRESGPNLIQINMRGRLLQIEFEDTGEPRSTENYRIPYVLEGAVRSFNQDLLDRNTIDEQAIFYCTEGARAQWHCFDGKTYRGGRLTQDFFIREMERLVRERHSR